MFNLNDGEFLKADPGSGDLDETEKELQASLEAFEKSVKKGEEPPAARAAEGAEGTEESDTIEKGKMYAVKMGGYDVQMKKADYDKYKAATAKAATAKANGDDDNDEDTEKSTAGDEFGDFGDQIVKSLEALDIEEPSAEPPAEAGEGQVELHDATPLLKAVSEQVGKNDEFIAKQIGVLQKSVKALMTAQTQMIKAATKTQEAVTAIGDTSATGGRRSGQVPALSEDDVKKAMTLNSDTWERVMTAAEEACVEGKISGLDLVQLEGYQMKSIPIPQVQVLKSELFKQITPFMKDAA